MKNKDTINQAQLEIAQRISNAAKEGNTEEFESGIQEMFQNIHDSIIEQAASMQGAADSAILAQRGIRQLTSEELSFYNTLIDTIKAAGTNNAMMALSNTDKTFPLTIINEVMEDMKQEHPLLAAVDTVNVTGLTKFLMNTDAGDNAAWGALESQITEEIASGFKEIDLGQFKLSAFMPISIDMLELGPKWIDSYIRICLSEALAIGYENAIITGTGKDMPIGMDRSVADDVVVTGGVYPKKDAISVTDLGRSSYGNLVSKLAKTQYGKARAIRGLILVVNPFDYYKTVMPATTVMTPEGHYVNDVLPVPTQIIQSVAVTQGEAILGMGKKYFLGVGGKRGIQFSDDYKFIEDKRFYKIVAYSNGRPKDDNAFLRLNIANLEPLYLEVKDVASI
ncbi:MAG: phage major capsid protein [Lachnospiraceae bacterium]|nr:phage major capsid protein [Lachnospiraceae bacterium]